VKVAALPRGVDPADLARTDSAALEVAVRDARPFLGFRLDRVLEAADLSTPEGRARGAEAALAVIAEHPSDLVRDQYLHTVADRCRIDVDRLRSGALGAAQRAETERRTGGVRGDRMPTEQRRPAPRRRDSAEQEALRLAVHRRDEILDQLEPWLFDDEIVAAAVDALGTQPDVRSAIAAADPETAELLQRTAVEDSSADPDDVVGLLVVAAAQRALDGFEVEARQADDALPYSEITGWLRLRIMEMRDAGTESEARKALLDWLRQRAIGES
jgi:DNA primase